MILQSRFGGFIGSLGNIRADQISGSGHAHWRDTAVYVSLSSRTSPFRMNLYSPLQFAVMWSTEHSAGP
jgi:hypothetical protein